jgi:hypothetical protein
VRFRYSDLKEAAYVWRERYGISIELRCLGELDERGEDGG